MNQQEIIKKHIKHGKIAHAYLLAGPPECASEKEHFVADIANLLEVPPANHMIMGKNEDTITIDMIRDLKTIAALSAGNTPRVVVFYHADAFTAQAANAFLKTLEEPPSHTIFFLLASSRAGLLPTLLSRVWTVRFNLTSIAQHSISDRSQSLNVWRHDLDFFQKPLAERYAINEKLAKADDHGKQFVADLITHLRHEAKDEIKKPRIVPLSGTLQGRAIDILPHAMEAYELLYLSGAPYRLILDTLASVAYE